MVAVGQALMVRPKWLLLDEPAAGLAPTLVDELYRVFRQLVEEGLGLLIVDQSIDRAMAYTDRFYVMDGGTIVHSGASEMSAREEINAIVLGLR